MTNREAIEVLQAYYTDSCYYALLQDAINTAIDALSAEPTDEAVKEYCRKRDLSLISNDLFYKMSSTQPTLHGYSIEHLEMIARVLQKENLPPERVVESLTDMGRIVAIVRDEFEETLRKAVEQCKI